jgi:hypothetical protein
MVKKKVLLRDSSLQKFHFYLQLPSVDSLVTLKSEVPVQYYVIFHENSFAGSAQNGGAPTGGRG